MNHSHQIEHIIVFGGYFDPPHQGHINLVRSAQAEFPQATIMIVPSFSPPPSAAGKGGAHSAFADRMAMCKLAFADFNNSIHISNIEENLPAPNYSVQTLESIQKTYKPHRLSFLMGDDQYRQFDTWFQYETILKQCDLIVGSRNPAQVALHTLPAIGKRTYILANPAHVIDSTSIRNNPTSFTKHVPPNVMAYIEKKALYAKERL